MFRKRSKRLSNYLTYEETLAIVYRSIIQYFVREILDAIKNMLSKILKDRLDYTKVHFYDVYYREQRLQISGLMPTNQFSQPGVVFGFAKVRIPTVLDYEMTYYPRMKRLRVRLVDEISVSPYSLFSGIS